MTYPAETRQRAIELRLQGFTLREIGQKLDVNHQTVADWCDDHRPEAAQARQQRIFTGNQDLHLEAQQKVAERLPQMSDRDTIATYSATSHANLNAIRLMQDERRHSNELLEQLRQQLRTKTPAELKAISLHAEDASLLEGHPGDSSNAEYHTTQAENPREPS